MRTAFVLVRQIRAGRFSPGLALAGTAALVALLASAGCSGSPAAPVTRPTAPVIAPGEPGEPARTLQPSEAATAIPTPTANAADVLFMQNMIVHHRQALDMSLLAPSRAASDGVRRFADRIKDTQGPEINLMTSWLREQGQKVPDHHAAHAGMPGMATPEQLDRLKAATGEEFDQLYVQLMIAHHQGAITMAREVLERGSHVRVLELAEDISVTQAVEINRMSRL
ncbi:uncharacterized protein (DUF305 family) [Thermocatellispora tengchongensis]|uniref:Uncharacterized protein (DUF305 family) n=1 Tax=Thermocatellispora tengchongensis TaxID=1073253 RepID=A0A840PFJ7_9ACTN|nr:DUF305 domain-containing protein [Thermocatellispora tengchongensis]MBB5134815.1 uncharacterized protein (DUF305 family) [Thermocatellispora tengchongensis]